MPPSQESFEWIPSWSGITVEDISLLVGWESTADTIEIRRIPINQDVATALRNPVEETLLKLGNNTAVSYSPDLELEDNQFAALKLESVINEMSLIAELEDAIQSPIDTPDFERNLFFYAMDFTSSDQRYIFIKRTNPQAYLRDRFITFFNETLTVVNNPLLWFDLHEIDLVLVVGEGLIIRDLKIFERLFFESPQIANRIESKVSELNVVRPMTDESVSALREVAKRNSRVRSRLYSILQRGHLSGVKIAVIRDAMLNHGLDPSKHFKGRKLSFTEDEVNEIVQLLNEDLNFGELTFEEFVINRKSRRQ